MRVLFRPRIALLHVHCPVRRVMSRSLAACFRYNRIHPYRLRSAGPHHATLLQAGVKRRCRRLEGLVGVLEHCYLEGGAFGPGASA